jgi:hypothetical protein
MDARDEAFLIHTLATAEDSVYQRVTETVTLLRQSLKETKAVVARKRAPRSDRGKKRGLPDDSITQGIVSARAPQPRFPPG